MAYQGQAGRGWTPARIVRFGTFELDVRAGELRKHNLKIRLPGQPFQILLMLLERPGDVVLREEIQQRLWPNNTIVEFNHSINAAIKRLRDALGETAEDPRYVETLARRGYRFLGQVEIVPEHPAEAGREASASESSTPEETGDRLGKTISGSSVQASLAGRAMGHRAEVKAALERVPGVPAEQAAPSIAVLPFTNLSPDKENECFGDGLAEEVIGALTKIAGLRVIARTSSFRFRGEQDLRKVGDTLKVRTVLEGGIRRVGSRIRVTAQLIQIDDESHLWSERYDRELTDIFAIQDDIAQSIVDALKLKLARPARPGQTVVKRRTASMGAYQLYLMGMHHVTPGEAARYRKGEE